MGIILSALAAAGDAGVQSMNQNIDQQNKMGLQQQQMDLALQKEKAIEDYKITLANKQREAMAGRLAVPDGITNGITQANANKFYGNDGGDHSVGAMADEEVAQFQPNQRQILEARAQQAIKTGDYVVAQELTKILDAGKVNIGYGSKVIDQNDIDPVTGEPRVLGDNSTGRETNGAAMASARQTAADAAMVRSKAIANATGSKDPVLASLGKTASDARIALDHLRGLQANNPPRAGHPDPYAPLIEEAQSNLDAATERLIDRQNSHLKTPTNISTDQSVKSTSAYAEGTILVGPGGNKYIVKNGVPVPK
jgi:hypothetical protein